MFLRRFLFFVSSLSISPIVPFAFADTAESPVTFAKDVAPIVFEKCASCHRPGEAAPFSLTDYQSVRRKAETISQVVSDRIMPPWHPEPAWGEFRDNRRLSDSEISLISQWARNGAPQGDPAETPELPDFPKGWSLGRPDLVLEMDGIFKVVAEGDDIYRYFVLPLALPEDKWVRAVELRPSARSVVHHALFFLDNKKRARELDKKDGQAGFSGRGFRSTGSLGGWAVGGLPLDLSENYGRLLPKGSDIVLQTHFHPTGKVEHEKSKIGLYFTEKPPEKRLVEFQVPPDFGNRTGLNVGPGESNYMLRDHLIVPEDIELITAWGHAHQICTSIQAEATLPDGTRKKLLRIGNWQFNWQEQYAYQDPVHLPKGTRIDTVITYDNSTDNESNPHSPPRRIFWGEQSSDEMGSLIFHCVASDQKNYEVLQTGFKKQRDASRKRFKESFIKAARRFIVLFNDKNKDDQLEIKEIEQKYHSLFRLLDDDKNGYVTVPEIDAKGHILDRLGSGSSN